MAIIDKIKAKAKADVKHIVLPEGEETRNAQAAAIIAREGLAKLTLLGDPEKVKEVAAGASLDGLTIINPKTSDKCAEYANTLYELRKAKGDPILTMCLCGAAGLVLHLVLPVA